MEKLNGVPAWITEMELKENFSLLNTQKSENFKADMTEVEIMGIRKIIEILEDEGFETDSGEYAYTSSSGYAMLNYLGDEYILDYETGESVSHFGMLHNGVLVMVTWDKAENEKHYRVDWN